MLAPYHSPVKHFIWDNFVQPQPSWELPTEWEAVYTSDVERGKKTTRKLPPWATAVHAAMTGDGVLKWCRDFFCDALTVDETLWGGGLQVMEAGSRLGAHLDGVVHPQLPGMRRAVQLVCFCHAEWRREWGGAFAFTTPNGTVCAEIEPVPGRLIAFASADDLAYHAVLPTAVDAPPRVTVACSLLAKAWLSDTRTRALFLPPR